MPFEYRDVPTRQRGHDGICDRCGKQMEPVHEGHYPGVQYRGALMVTLSGGFGMYFDNIEGDEAALICEDCARTFIGSEPWVSPKLANALRRRSMDAFSMQHRGMKWDEWLEHCERNAICADCGKPLSEPGVPGICASGHTPEEG